MKIRKKSIAEMRSLSGTDTIRDKHFAGGVRTIVSVDRIFFGKCEIDVIDVHNSDETPFYLTDNYQSVIQYGRNQRRILEFTDTEKYV